MAVVLALCMIQIWPAAESTKTTQLFLLRVSAARSFFCSEFWRCLGPHPWVSFPLLEYQHTILLKYFIVHTEMSRANYLRLKGGE